MLRRVWRENNVSCQLRCSAETVRLRVEAIFPNPVPTWPVNLKVAQVARKCTRRGHFTDEFRYSTLIVTVKRYMLQRIR